MIRRWSHINLTNIELNSFSKFEKKQKITNFKSLVNLKRFTFKLTKFKRKSMARFKHTSNWLIYTNVFKLWSKDYIFQRHYVKFQYLNKAFVDNFFVYNFNFIKLTNDMFFNNFNFFFSTFSKKAYFYFNKSNFSYFKYNNLTVISTLETPLTGNSVVLSYSEWDKTLFPTPTANKPSIIDGIDDLFNELFQINISNLLEIRKILSILLFFNLNFKKVK